MPSSISEGCIRFAVELLNSQFDVHVEYFVYMYVT